MMIANVCIGDTVVSLLSVQALVPDPIEGHRPIHYELHFLDLPTGERDCIVIQGENEALVTFAAWIVQDEEYIGMLDKRVQMMRDTIGKRSKKFMA